ncbi:MAG: heparinase II/III-family protein, partial [bacterium]
EKDIMQIIYAHIVMVMDNPEYDIDGNHLLTNLCAARFGLQFFKGSHADLLRKKVCKKLSSVLEEQINEDGGHCERSFMYHSLILEMLLDMKNVGCEEHDNYVVKMSKYLNYFTDNTAEIPLFNDSAFGVSRNPAELLCYAEKCGLFETRSSVNQKVAEIFTATNFAVLKKGPWLIHFDGGGVFPPQPGHAHSSGLSFELYKNGEKVITDPGCFTYREGNMRRHLRSTSAHNTLTVDGKNQDEIWGAFRMGGRAEHFPLEISEKAVTGRLKTWYGAFQKRTVSVFDNKVKIHDIFEFPGSHEAVIRYLILDSSLKVTCPELLESSTEKKSCFQFFNTENSALQMEFRKSFTKSVSITTIINR